MKGKSLTSKQFLLKSLFKLVAVACPAVLMMSPSWAQQDSPAVGQHGRKSLRLLRIGKAPELDGKLDEQVWKQAEIAGGFLQRDPEEGSPATDQLRQSFNIFSGEKGILPGRRGGFEFGAVVPLLANWIDLW